MKLLLIEDDLTLQAQLQKTLSASGYQVDCSGDGEDGLYRLREYQYNLAIIDIGLPNLSGIELIKILRAEKNAIPILILTARSSWKDKVIGLKAGSDDYLVKPFQVEELLARTEALLRRAGGYTNNELEHGPFCLNMKSEELWVGDDEIELTAFEHKLMEYFLLHTKQIITKTALMDYLYEDDIDRDTNVVEVLIGRLRRKIDPKNKLKPIETLRGRGYRFYIKPSDESQ